MKNKFLVFSFLTATIFVSSFFIFTAPVFASTTETFLVTSGTDASGVTPSAFIASDITKLGASDENRIQSNAVTWPIGTDYDENKYIEFNFTPDIPTGMVIENITISHEFRRSGALTNAKLEIWDGTNYVDEPLTIGTANVDHTDSIDATLYINTPEKVNSLKARFLAYRATGVNTKTSHDYISISVTYSTPIPGTHVTEDIIADTTWDLAGSPYLIENTILVDTGVILNIEAGVQVNFSDRKNLDILGKLMVQGSASQKVSFSGLPNLSYSINFSNSTESIISNATFENAYDAIYLDNSDLDVNNIEIFNSHDGIVTYESTLLADEVECSNIEDSCFVLYEHSIIDLNNIDINGTSGGNAIVAFNDSIVSANNLDINCIFDEYGDAIDIFNNTNFTLTNSFIRDPSSLYEASIGIFDSDGLITSILVVDNTLFEGGANNGIDVYNEQTVSVSNSIFKNFEEYAILNEGLVLVDAKNNYWNDETGPTNAIGNPDGFGERVSINVDYNPWCTEESCGVTPPPPTEYQCSDGDDNDGDGLIDMEDIGCSSETDDDEFNVIIPPTPDPVIIIPGITGSYLLKNYDDNEEIWMDLFKMILPGGDSYLNDLALLSNGSEDPQHPIIVGDIFRGISALGVHVFDELITEFNNNGYIEGDNLFVFPYDWRKSTAENEILLKNKIEAVLSQTGKTKVDIVAHSMGGLIIKKYIATEGHNKIDQVIFLGTPHLGAPKAFKILMYGDDMGIKKLGISLLSPNRVNFISQNMPAVHELLPSEKYGNYVINEGDGSSVPINFNYSQTKDFMIEKGRNSAMFPFAENLHDSIDDLDLSRVQTYNFIGCGSKTIGQITLKQELSWTSLWLKLVDDYDLGYVNGDETVPLISADGIIADNKYFVKKITHGDLPSAEGVKQDVVAILKDEALPSSPIVLSNTDSCNVSGNVVSVHSPVLLHVYDEAGNHTGPNADGDIEHGVEGVQYDVIEGEKFAFLPDGVNYKVITKATDTGGYSFVIKKQDKDDAINAVYNWKLIPLETISSQGEIWIGPSYPAVDYSVKMDEDGNGSVDKTFPASFDGTAEAIKSTTVINKSGSVGVSLAVNNIKKDPIALVSELVKDLKVPNNAEIKIQNEKPEIKVENSEIVDVFNKEGDEENNPLENQIASPVNSVIGTKVKIVWSFVTVSLIIFGILAKRFIKA